MGHWARMGKDTTFRVGMSRPWAKIPVRRPRRRWIDNVSSEARGSGGGV